MAYARFARDCDWYIYWYASPKEGAQQFALDHASAQGRVHLLSSDEVVAMLASGDFREVPGRTPAHDALLARCFREFIIDVSSET